MDEKFFQSGCFFYDRENDKVVFSKGGEWSDIEPVQEKFFFLRLFYDEKVLFLINDEKYHASTEEVINFVNEFKNIKINLKTVENFDSLFVNDFNKFKKYSERGLKKAVLLSRKVLASSDMSSLKKKAIASSILNPFGWAYGLWTPETLIIGVTPEILLKTDGKSISTFALAGTSLKTEEKILLNSEKDLIEHRLVIKNIIEDLEPFCTRLEAGELHTTPYGNLIHLKTEIKGNLKSTNDLWTIISKLTPTAALGGYPRNLAMDFLKETEYFKNFKLRLHGSTLGFFENGNSNSIVMIRNVQADKDHIFFEAGAGIVEQSDELKELQEINRKIEITKEMIL